MSGQTLRRTAPPAPLTQPDHERRLRLTLGLVGAIWLLGLVGHFTPLTEWPALFLYVIGAIFMTLRYCARADAWRKVGITRHNLGPAILWGGVLGVALMLMDWGNTYMYYRAGNAPMAEMETILVKMGFIYLFPVLVLAEEFLWRGMLLSALRDRGMNIHLAVVITTLAYAVNHYAVAPVGFTERGLMAIMALPIGILGGYLTLRLRNLWVAVIIHLCTFISMVVDIYVLPGLAR
ncbi:MAG: CPBP family intramembrane metalloprotease [Chloroflexales bacterium]|nr:CPBP family intramembrane metalloprotease [Chloroflexales bacterium]